MSQREAVLACIGGRLAHELLNYAWPDHQRLGSRITPFGKSQTIYRCQTAAGEFLLLLRHSDGPSPIASSFVNYRANLYALKDLGVTHVLACSSARAVSHNFHVGQFAVLKDVIDETRHRPGTFFEHGAMVEVRQWPVFCPSLRPLLCRVLEGLGARFCDGGTYLCTEGPRRETPAEVYKYATWGADLLGHSLAPETFLAKELQMCYSGLALVSDYAETGSEHRPFEAGSLFAGLEPKNRCDRTQEALALIPRIVEQVLAQKAQLSLDCPCQRSLADLIRAGQLTGDFRTWFAALRPASVLAGLHSAITAKPAFTSGEWAQS